MACVVVILFATLAVHARGLWAPDELRYAQIVQGMDRLADWFVLRLWGHVYLDKPPLYFWLVRAIAPLTGGVYLVTLLAPVVMASCLLLWLTERIGAAWFGQGTGAASILVLVTLPLFLLLSSIGRMDMLLALFVTAAVFEFYRGYAEGNAAARVWAFVWMAMGLLAKGPFGIVFPLAVAVAALAISGKWKSLACRESIWGTIILAGTSACWLVPAVSVAGDSVLRGLIGRQVLDRAVSGLDHAEPAYFYAWMLPITLLPWVVLLGSSLRKSWQGWRKNRAEQDLWLLCWIIVPLVVLSIVREKMPVYLLPIMPAFAVLLGRHCCDLIAGQSMPRPISIRVRALFAVTATMGVAGLAVGAATTQSSAGLLGDFLGGRHSGEITAMLLESRTLFIGGGILVTLAVFGWIGSRASRGRALKWTMGTLASVAPCGQLFLTLHVMPALDRAQSWCAVAEAIQTTQTSEKPFVLYRVRPYAGYYLCDDFTWVKTEQMLGNFVRHYGPTWCATTPAFLDEIGRHCVVEHGAGQLYPSPMGPVVMVQLRPLDVARAAERPLR